MIFRTIANYQLWKIADNFYSYLAPSLRKHEIEYNKAVDGTSQMAERCMHQKILPPQPLTKGNLKPFFRWEECVGAVKGAFDWAVGALYVKKHFPRSSRDEVSILA